MKEQNDYQHTKPGIKDKQVVIIGGSSGIGLATAKAAAGEGAIVTIASSNHERITRSLKELPAGSKGYTVNITDETQVATMFRQLGNIDHLVFTAGESLQLGNITDLSMADARSFFNVRYWGALTAVKHAAPYINLNGSIVLTSGIASVRPREGWSLGASICAAMEGFTRAMAVELAPIRVNIVSPGVVRTDLWRTMPQEERENFYASVGSSLLVKRIGEAEDIAQAYLYLMKQQFSTGQVIVVDGGGVLV